MKRKGKLSAAGLTFGLVVVIQGGCAGTTKVTQPAAQTTPVQKEAVMTDAREAKPAEKLILAGKVVETMQAGGYTYIALEKDGKKGWVAVPPTQVAIGQEVQVRPGTEMGKFTSKTLNRTFENILFSSGLVTEESAKAPEGEPQMPPGHPSTDKMVKPKGMAAMMGAGGAEEMSGKLAGKVVETFDGGSYTYISLEKDGKKTWAAVPAMKVTIGEEMDLQPGAAMTNFTSKSLNRTFESIIFSGGPVNK